jgi:hypothetical protein
MVQFNSDSYGNRQKSKTRKDDKIRGIETQVTKRWEVRLLYALECLHNKNSILTYMYTVILVQ